MSKANQLLSDERYKIALNIALEDASKPDVSSETVLNRATSFLAGNGIPRDEAKPNLRLLLAGGGGGGGGGGGTPTPPSIPVTRQFDFNRGMDDATMSATPAGYIGVRFNHQTPAVNGFGWTVPVSAFTCTTNPPGVSPVDLY